MSYRPRPNVTRARRQVERHAFEIGPALPARPLSPVEEQLFGGMVHAAQAASEALAVRLREVFPKPGEYRMSTR